MGDLNCVIITTIARHNRVDNNFKTMIRKITTAVISFVASVAFAMPALAQMNDDQILSYAKEALSSGKSTTALVKELASKGVTLEQVQRMQALVNGQTGMNSLAENFVEVGGQERMRRVAGTMNSSTSGLENIANEYSAYATLADTSAMSMMAANQYAQAPYAQNAYAQAPYAQVGAQAAYMQNPYMAQTQMVDPRFQGETTSKIFGHSIFKTSYLTFAPNENIATPEEYKLGPGDEVFIDIWGSNQTTIRETISPDGFIMVQNYGLLPLNGMTVKEADAYVRKQLGKIYSIDGEDAQSDMKLTLGAVRTINVNVMGEVANPGTYYMSSLSSIYHALYAAGGFTELGSVRNISLIRNGKEVTKVDVYDFLIKGEAAEDVILQEGDIVVVPTYDMLVTIEGNVKRPMIYEMVKGEKVEDVINYAGGFKGDAYTSNLKMLRRNGRELQVYTVLESQYPTFQLMDSDVVTVSEVLDRFENRVEVKGAVYRAGVYQLCPEINSVKTLIQIADGLKGDAFMNRAIIQRQKPDYTFETISFDLKAIMDGSAEDVALQNNDVLYVSSIHDLQDMGHITVSGEVARPGSYVFASNTTIEDAIIQAGGLLESASTAKIDVSRRIKNPTSTDVSDTLSYTFTYNIQDGFVMGGEEFVLQPYDRIYVRKSPTYNVQNHVTISGEVVYPGSYALSQRESRLSDLVAEAGGITKWSYVKGAKLVRKMTAEEKAIVQATIDALGNAKGAIEGLIDPTQSTYTVGINLEDALAKPGSDVDVVLRDGDRLVIPEYTNIVKISGNVMYPNVVTYNHSMTVRDFVTMAGGYGYKAKKSKAYVVYMNGTVAKARGTSKGVVEPGCEIIIPTKIKDPSVLPTIMSIVSATSSTASMLSTIYALINSAVK